MAIEIERKFLVDIARWSPRSPGLAMTQGYFTARRGPGRVRLAGETAWLTFKSPAMAGGLTREEHEFGISSGLARHLLAHICEPLLIHKTRYTEDWAGHRWEIDVFEAENRGLVVAEIELQSEDEPFERPPWVLEEVTHDPRYLNARLRLAPFTTWGTPPRG